MTRPSLTLIALLSLAASAQAQTPPAPDCQWDDCSGPQFSPGCTPGWVCPFLPPAPPAIPVGPAEVCFGVDGCTPVRYWVEGGFMLAETVIPGGFGVLGWAGPCHGPMESCPDIARQAWGDARNTALKIHRGLRHEERP